MKKSSPENFNKKLSVISIDDHITSDSDQDNNNHQHHHNVEVHTKGGSLWKDIRSVYKFKEVIGGGHFGTVRLGYIKEDKNKKLYAIKSISKKNVSKDDLDEMIKETEILSSLDHPNIIKFHETYNDEYYFHLVMERARGKDVFDKIIDEGHLTEKIVSKIIFEVLNALVYCHEHHIAHRDLKPENMLFEDEKCIGEIKLIDFGLSAKYNDKEKMHYVLGTPYYVAPEVLKGSYDEKCDIWSVGAMVYIMLTGEPPFNGKTNQDIFKSILNNELKFPEEKFTEVSKCGIDFMKHCLIKDPVKRFCAEKALKHKWFESVNNEIHDKKHLDVDIMKNLKSFTCCDKFQKLVLKFITNSMKEKELLHLREVFQAMDTENHGYLDKSEIQDGFKKVGINISKNEVEDLVDKIEDWEHGKINYSDFITAAMDFKSNVSKEKLISAFSYFDFDKTGKISDTDIENALLRSGKKITNHTEVNEIIKEATRGKESNKITLEEYLNMFGYKN